MNTTDTLEKGRKAFRQKAWRNAFDHLSIVYNESRIEAGDIELLAKTAYLIGKDSDCIDIWGHAHQEYLNKNDMRKAADCAFWIGMVLFNRGENARGSGWIARAQRLLEDYSQDCVEKGFLLIPEALQCLRNGEPAKAFDQFKKAGDIGSTFNNPDLLTFSRLGRGQALIHQEKFTEGTQLLDEAMVDVVTDDASPIVAGIAYCAVLGICRKIYDLRRAREWTAAFSRWCDSQPALIPYRGQCLVQRAEIMQMYGEWPDAMAEVQRACELAESSSPPATGEAFYCQAELFRLQGEFKKAEEAYRKANKWGRKPQPGLALLRLSQGKKDAAEASIRRVQEEKKDLVTRSRILPAFVEIMLAAGDTGAAETAAEELTRIADVFQSSYLQAIAVRAQGNILLINGEPHPALDKLLQAWSLLKGMEGSYESARTRVLIGHAYLKLDDKDTAEMELDAARWMFRQLGAAHDLAKIDSLHQKSESGDTYGLTPRELEVLCCLATGKTNKAIASDLFISERTVDRHVSNILDKLNLPSRAAATAFAYEHNLI